MRVPGHLWTHKHSRALLFVTVVALSCQQEPFTLPCSAAESAEAAAPTRFPAHPRLLLDTNGIAELKKKIVDAAWAKASWAELTTKVNRAKQKPILLPPRGGNWSHNYVCPAHGARLRQGQQLSAWEWEHLCPVGNHRLRGDRSKASLDFDGNAISAIHAEYAREIVDNGLVFQVTGDMAYSRRARELLLAYANRYRQYALHDNQGNPGPGGRVASQSLTEATWLIEVAQGADLIWTTLTEGERKSVEDKLLRPALEEVILPRRLGIHNIQCRHNSAIGLVGFLLADARLISLAIDDPQTGFRSQMDKGVLADGMWLEGSSGYHFFTIAGLWPLAEAARNCGIDLYDSKLRTMFEGPLNLAMPNFVLPNFNDSGYVSLAGQADYYELALSRYGNETGVPLLQRSERKGRLALLFGRLALPADERSLSTQRSRNLTASGYIILQGGTGQQATWLGLKYGPHGGGHGHPDKNSFVLYARGQVLATDAGTHAYGSPLHRDWDKTSFAHNTLVVDETSQQPATGICLGFGSERGVDYSITQAGEIYPGINFIRTALMCSPELIVLVDQIVSETSRTFDMVYHQAGEWEQAGEWKSWNSPGRPGYVHLKEAAAVSLDDSQTRRLGTRVNDRWKPSVLLRACGPTEVVRGYGILDTTEDKAPLLIQRKRGREAVFCWAIVLDGSTVDLQIASVHERSGKPISQAAALLVEVKGATQQRCFVLNPAGRPIAARVGNSAIETGARLTVVR